MAYRPVKISKVFLCHVGNFHNRQNHSFSSENLSFLPLIDAMANVVAQNVPRNQIFLCSVVHSKPMRYEFSSRQLMCLPYSTSAYPLCHFCIHQAGVIAGGKMLNSTQQC